MPYNSLSGMHTNSNFSLIQNNSFTHLEEILRCNSKWRSIEKQNSYHALLLPFDICSERGRIVEKIPKPGDCSRSRSPRRR
jgi:hypothetical protein